MKKIYIVSLKFSPGHIEQIKAFYKAYKLKYDVECYVNEKYFDYLDICKKTTTLNSNDYENIFFFVSPSLDNHYLAKKIKKHKGIVIYQYHEPWRGYINYIKECGSLDAIIKVPLIHYFQSQMLKYTDKIVLPSIAAKKLFEENEKRDFIKKTKILYLMFSDDCTMPSLKVEKRFFSYIGSVLKVHAFDKYVDFIINNYDKCDFDFLIATKNVIDESILLKLDPLIKKNRIKLIYGKPMSDKEINQYYLRSFLVWNCYRNSTQSGVLPMAFMNGTPVLAKKIGSFPEFICEYRNGVFVNEYDNKEILKGIKYSYDNINEMKYNCRKSFLDNFYYGNNLDLIYSLIEE